MRKSVYPLLLLVFICCSGFKACIFVGDPESDQNVAVNHDWIVTGSNTSWIFTPVPGSGNGNLPYHATPQYFAAPGHPCYGMTLYGEPMAYTDPVDQTFWWHINDGHQGCLFHSAGRDPRGPFSQAFITPVADGLWLTVTRDKVVLMGYTVPLHVNAMVFNKGNLNLNQTIPLTMTGLSTPCWAHPIHNKTVGPYQNDAWLMGRGLVKSDGRRVIHLTKIVGVPGIGAGITATVYDIPLPSNDLPFMEPDPENATQPDGSVVHFANGTPGMWTNNGTATGLAWIFQAGAPNGTPRLGLYAIDLVNFADGPRVHLAEQIEPPLLGSLVTPGAAYGCPTLAVLNNTQYGQVPILGVSAAAPTKYLSAFQMRHGALWFSVAEGPGPMGSNHRDNRLDFCVGTTTADPNTACHVQAYAISGNVASQTKCFDQY